MTSLDHTYTGYAHTQRLTPPPLAAFFVSGHGIIRQQQCIMSHYSLRASHITDEKWTMTSSFDCWPPSRQHQLHLKYGVISYLYRLCIEVIPRAHLLFCSFWGQNKQQYESEFQQILWKFSGSPPDLEILHATEKRGIRREHNIAHSTGESKLGFVQCPRMIGHVKV